MRSVPAVLAGVLALLIVTACADSPSEPPPTATTVETAAPTSVPTGTACNPTPTAVPEPTVTPTVPPEPTPQGGIPLPPPGPEERWIRVDLREQTATGMVGDERWHTAPATTGKEGFETPVGEFRILYRIYNETMSGASGDETWYVENVLFTQYFTDRGHALHLNYWADDSVFGRVGTSHGCVGLRYADAEFFWNFATIGTRVVVQN